MSHRGEGVIRKASITIAAMLLALGAAGAAYAQQQGPQHGGMMGHGIIIDMDSDDWDTMPMMMHMHGMTGQGSMPGMGMGRQVEGRLAFLKIELKITPAQGPLWSTLAGAMRANAQRMADIMPCCSGRQGRGATHPGGTTAQAAAPRLPERLDRQEKLLAAQLAALRTMKGALTPLYAAFSDEQRQAADQLIRGPIAMGMMM